MASPFQQQARQRKFLYLGLIVALFTLSLVWRRTVVADQARELAIREESRGEVEFTGAVVRLGLTGSRGVAICILWSRAMEKQKKNQWNELEVIVRALTKLQPHFTTPWLFQSWNLAYNVSVESDRIGDKYFYITRGIELLAEGERQNRNHPDLRWSLGFYLQHKICQSDETNYHRSLFHLSMIPPNERDPARFWKQTDEGPVFNWVEFHKFVLEHPQLIRRLRNGLARTNLYEKRQQFTCETPEAVVQFLDDNFHVPSMYRFTPPPGVPAAQRLWDPNKKDDLLLPAERFPILPPRHDSPFDATALSDESTLRDDIDGYAAAHAWFCYAQEPLPEPGKLPGSSVPIKDRTRQRRPKHMATLIFRNYPAQGRRFMAERLQQEGWFDDEGWDISEWFEQARDASVAGREVKVGGGIKWSEEAWKRAHAAWEKNGRENHLVISVAEEENIRDDATRFAARYGRQLGQPPPAVREEELSPEEKRQYDAAKFLFEYDFYRRLTNFAHHYNRAFMESHPETVACRKMFYKAEQLNLAGSPTAALNVYQTAVDVPAWRDLAGKRAEREKVPARNLNPLEAWREVLLGNKEFRRDPNTQELTAEYQIRYLLVYNRFDGKKLKEDLGRMAAVLPLVPKFTQDMFRPPVFEGPFDIEDSEGYPLIEEHYKDITMDRLRFPRKRVTSTPAKTPPPPAKMTSRP
jgi:hypothetical protein